MNLFLDCCNSNVNHPNTAEVLAYDIFSGNIKNDMKSLAFTKSNYGLPKIAEDFLLVSKEYWNKKFLVMGSAGGNTDLESITIDNKGEILGQLGLCVNNIIIQLYQNDIDFAVVLDAVIGTQEQRENTRQLCELFGIAIISTQEAVELVDKQQEY